MVNFLVKDQPISWFFKNAFYRRNDIANEEFSAFKRANKSLLEAEEQFVSLLLPEDYGKLARYAGFSLEQKISNYITDLELKYRIIDANVIAYERDDDAFGGPIQESTLNRLRNECNQKQRKIRETVEELNTLRDSIRSLLAQRKKALRQLKFLVEERDLTEHLWQDLIDDPNSTANTYQLLVDEGIQPNRGHLQQDVNRLSSQNLTYALIAKKCENRAFKRQSDISTILMNKVFNILSSSQNLDEVWKAEFKRMKEAKKFTPKNWVGQYLREEAITGKIGNMYAEIYVKAFLHKFGHLLQPEEISEMIKLAVQKDTMFDSIRKFQGYCCHEKSLTLYDRVTTIDGGKVVAYDPSQPFSELECDANIVNLYKKQQEYNASHPNARISRISEEEYKKAFSAVKISEYGAKLLLIKYKFEIIKQLLEDHIIDGKVHKIMEGKVIKEMLEWKEQINELPVDQKTRDDIESKSFLEAQEGFNSEYLKSVLSRTDPVSKSSCIISDLRLTEFISQVRCEKEKFEEGYDHDHSPMQTALGSVVTSYEEYKGQEDIRESDKSVDQAVVREVP